MSSLNLFRATLSYKARRRAAPYLFLLPFIVLFGVFWAGPIVSSMYLSLTKWNGLRAPQYIGFENYINLFSDPVFHKSLRNTLIGAAIYDVLLVLMALILALVLHLPFCAGGRFLRRPILPVAISLAVVAFVFQLIYSAQGGLLNQLLALVGLPSNVNWLGVKRQNSDTFFGNRRSRCWSGLNASGRRSELMQTREKQRRGHDNGQGTDSKSNPRITATACFRCGRRRRFIRLREFVRHRGIADFVIVKIDQVRRWPSLISHSPEVVEVRPPLIVLFEIFGDVL